VTLTEEILDPDIEIIDAHHHFYDEGIHHGTRYEQFLVPELLDAAAAGHRVIGSIFVECSWRWDKDRDRLWAPLGEIGEVANAAREAVRSGGLRGVGAVGHVDLRQGEAVGEVLDAMRAEARGILVGIRHGTVWDADPAAPRSRTCDGPRLLADPMWRKGLREVVSRGLVFEAMVLHPQLPELVELARDFSDATIVVNHLGGPVTFGRYSSSAAEVARRWRTDMQALAGQPNVILKLGGIGNPFMLRDVPAARGLEGSEWIDQVWGDDIRWCIELFGANRCLFESNYPVDGKVAPYSILWNGFKQIVKAGSPLEKQDLFNGTARRTYQLAF
jgi:L-fuconolactonase